MSKRRKPWYRARNVILLTLVAGLIWIAWVVLGAMNARAGNAIDYAAKLNELARANQPGDPDAPNRWDDYLSLLERNAGVLNSFIPKGENQPDPVAWEQFVYGFRPDYPMLKGDAFAVQLDRAQGCVDAVRAAGIFDRIDSFLEPMPVYWETSGIDWTDDSSVRKIALMRRIPEGPLVDCILSMHRGDAANAAQSYERVVALAHINARQASLLGCLAGRTNWIVAHGRVREHMLAHDFDESVCDAMLGAMLDAEQPPIMIGVEAEKLFMLDLVQRCYTDDGRSDGAFLPNAFRKFELGTDNRLIDSMPGHPVSNLAGVMFTRKAETIEKLDAYFDEINAACGQRTHALRMQYIERARAMRTQWTDRDPVLQCMTELFEMMVASLGTPVVEHDGTVLTLAILRYHHLHGEPPPDLGALVPGVLDRLPTDPFAPDGRYRYKRIEPSMQDPRSFILYSVGTDGVDDGGVSPRNLYDALAVDGPGGDFVFNPNPIASDVDQ
ncbi:MAG: hypothetical protein H6812_12600 [Phycisphaeraceae bacterium]|nr:hypothetical protein [Phycisphaerales bacterium]MCB9844076.1 hypothetical protein [Phycisphaeraceae bacterium]